MAVASPKITTSTEEIKNIRDYWNRRLLMTARPKLVHQMFTNTEGIPSGFDAPSGLTAMTWLRFERISIPTDLTTIQAAYSAATLANHDAAAGGYKLTQGDDPTSSDPSAVDRNISVTKVTATPDEYGAYYVGSKRLKRAGFHNFREQVQKVLGWNMGEVLDLVCRNQVIGNMTLQYAGTATTVNTVAPGHLLNFAEIVEAVKTLKSNNAEPVKNDHFGAIIGPNTWGTIMLDPRFQEHVVLGGKSTMFDGKINKGALPWLGVEFNETSLSASQSGSLTTVHSTMIFAKDAVGSVKLDDMGAESIFHDVDSGGTQDPLNQRWTQGWTANMVAKVLNSAFGIEVRHAVAL